MTLASSKPQIFISHISEESQIAQVLQRHLVAAFGCSIETFVSSDKKSIGGGTQWFNHILANFSHSKIVFVLLSGVSVSCQWIPFEAGYGASAGVLVHREMESGRSPLASIAPIPPVHFAAEWRKAEGASTETTTGFEKEIRLASLIQARSRSTPPLTVGTRRGA